MDTLPYLDTFFLVTIGGARDAKANVGATGFCEVVFPELLVARESIIRKPEPGHAVLPPAQPAGISAEPARRSLLLRRGFSGSHDLYHWWDRTRRGHPPRQRTVTVELLDADRAQVLLRWKFFGTRPLALSYSPLRAMAPGVLMETIELAYERFELH